MKVLFILPGIGKKSGDKYLKSWLMEPLTIAVLKALTPPKHQTAFFDDRVEAVDYEADCDVVAIPIETYTARRAYEIAGRFKKRGKKVVFGGYHATLAPEDAAEHADIVVCGNVEGIWPQILEDIENGREKARYTGDFTLDYGQPDRSIYQAQMKKYLPVSLVEIGRGCRHNCEFCSIASYYEGCYKHRRIDDILTEIKACKHKLFFFVDDSIFSDKAFARELFTKVAKLKITWTTQVTLDIARDEELLKLMKTSGCCMVLIGFESINAENLRQMNKEWSEKLGERDELVQRIHRAGINIYASFVFGFDGDDEGSFKEVFAFSMRHQFFVVAFNHLLAFPNTATYDRFAAEGRLLHERWWMEPGYLYGNISFTPKLVSPDELRGFCGKYKKYFYTFRSIFKRGTTLFSRTRSPFIHFAYWFQNVLFHFEVDKRIGIPIGENLDEAVK